MISHQSTLFKSVLFLAVLCCHIDSAFPQTHFVVTSPRTHYRFDGLSLRQDSALHRPKVGLVLSGGGSRGLAQVGVIKVLEQHNIPIDLIVGNSMGAVIGGLYASGYSVAQVESISMHADWDDVLSFSEGTRRREVFVGEKQPDQTGFLTIRFDGLQPIIPSSVFSGQQLTNFFMNLTLQALYQPVRSFDDLKISFRAVATDLISGKRIVIDRGSLAEAMRASVTVPLLYSYLQKDSMELVDGGLLSNIPVDLARSMGCDVVIAVNSTSALRHEDQMNKPWEVADQIMTIMMQNSIRQELNLADVVITPDVGDRIVSDFSRVDTVVGAGERAANALVENIEAAIRHRTDTSTFAPERFFESVTVSFKGDDLPMWIQTEVKSDMSAHPLSSRLIEEDVRKISECGMCRDCRADVTVNGASADVAFIVTANPVVQKVAFTGNRVLSDSAVSLSVKKLEGKRLDFFEAQDSMESVVNLYNDRHYSLARVDSAAFDSASGVLSFAVNEGRIQGLYYEGNEQTRDYVLRREFPLNRGDIFNLDDAYRGLVNITSTGLFESVILDVRYKDRDPVLVLKVTEKSAEQLRLGIHADNEHNIVSTVDIRDANFRGAGENLGLLFDYGSRDRDVVTEYKASRIFQTYFTFNLKGYFSSHDILTYDDRIVDRGHWDIFEVGRYEQKRYGGSFTFGTQLQRLGDLTGELHIEHDRISPISGVTPAQLDYRLVGLKFQTTLDTENKFQFPTDGVVLKLAFETALTEMGSEVSFDKLDAFYESYSTILQRHTLHPRITFGFADEPLPINQQYSLGGYNSFFGLRENDSRGREMFLVNMEYRYWLPFKLIFETYLKLRYDLGTISDKPQELKLAGFHHGVGAEVAVDTPLGPASVGMGRSFYYRTELQGSPATIGPLLFYFTFGHTL